MRALLRLILLCGLAAGCASNPPATGNIRVDVELEAGLVSRCVKVTVSDGDERKETAPMLTDGKTLLVVAVLPEGMRSMVKVQAHGYSDDGCTRLTSPAERSDAVNAMFEVPVHNVRLVVRRAEDLSDAGTDAGVDGGVDAGTDAGTDAGVDAGVDFDGDGYVVGVDCDDSRADINPDAQELCGDGVDNDCDLLADCQQRPLCDGMACMGGTCMAGVCVQPMETLCGDGLDNDGDNAADCLDSDCLDLDCSDSNACTSSETCAADGGCVPLFTATCVSPPVCFTTPGTCNAADAGCDYVPTSGAAGSCDDGFKCTTSDRCDNGSCVTTPVTCNNPNQCQATGMCREDLDGGCFYPPLAVTDGCNDGDDCTTADHCDGDGGCTGSRSDCTPPSPCHVFTNACTSAGACVFAPQQGPACDAGMGVVGTCGPSFTCVPPVAALFPYTPSNFTEAQLPDAGASLTVTANTTINTNTVPPMVSNALVLPPMVEIDGGLLFRIDTLTINPGVTLMFTGSRPVIFAVTGDATVGLDAGVVARAGAGSTDCGGGGTGTQPGNGNCEAGGGGGGFGSAGGVGGQCMGGTRGTAGGVNGNAALTPLRGGCRGGGTQTDATLGGPGGGALQLSVAGTLRINGFVSAPGRGGEGASGNNNGGGGGGSGGGLLLEASVLDLQSNARVTANGGGGGEGVEDATGVDGDDGHSFDDQPAVGGAGASNGFDGAAGAAGNTVAADGRPNGGNNNTGAGGAGGGLGRVRFNVMTSCTRNGSAIVSPAATFGAATCP